MGACCAGTTASPSTATVPDTRFSDVSPAQSNAKGASYSGMSYTLYYYGAMGKFLGRGWAPLMILEEAGVTYDCKEQTEAPPNCFAPPMVTTPSGAAVSQTPVIVTVLGKETGLWPTDAAGDAKAMQYCADAADFFAEAMAKPADRIEKWLGFFEAALSTGPFMMGTKLTSVDFTLYTAFVVAQSKHPDSVAKFAKCTAFMALMTEQKGFKAVAAKNLPMMP